MVIEKIIDRICGILIHFWNNTEHQQNFKFYSRMKRVYLLAPKLEWKIVEVYYWHLRKSHWRQWGPGSLL